MRVGIALSGATMLDVAVACSRLAEELGFDSLWLTESTAHEAFTSLQALALSTERIKLGTGIVNVYTRPPALTAMALATLDEASRGRALLGLGVSNRSRMEGVYGLSYPSPLKRMREYVQAVRGILRGERVRFEGETLKVDFQLGFRPFRREVPIFLAALRRRMVELAGEVGDGVLLYFRKPEALKEAVSRAMSRAKASGRAEGFTPASFINLALAEDGEEARRIGKRVIVQFAGLEPYRRLMREQGYGGELQGIMEALGKGDAQGALEAVTEGMLSDLTISGSPSECGASVRRYLELGLGLAIFYLHPVGPDAKASLLFTIRSLAELAG